MEKILNGRNEYKLSCADGDYTVGGSIEKNEGMDVVRISFESSSETVPPVISLYWEIPHIDVQGIWHPTCQTGRGMPCVWGGFWSSNSACSAPVVTLFSSSGRNRQTFSCSDAVNKVEYKFALREEDSCYECEVRFFNSPTAPLDKYSADIRVDYRDIRYEDAIADVAEWWAQMPEYTPMDVPEECISPVYSTWYSFHQKAYGDEIEKVLESAAPLGFSSVIVDDGWQMEDSARSYAYCGDWEPAPEKIPDMKKHVENVHKLGMKYFLWYSVPYVGKYSRAYETFRGKYFGKGDTVVLDPRYPEVREYLITTYERAVREWDLDGFKLDFIDSFHQPEKEDPDAAPGRDYVSVPAAVDRLMTDVKTRLTALKPNICIEFRQSYIGPLMRKFGNMFRAGDCANDTVTNKLRTIDLRLSLGNSPAHADMLTWNPEDTVEAAALQLESTMFAVPQISVRPYNLPKEHNVMLKNWLDFWKSHRKTLLFGKFRAHNPELLYSQASAEDENCFAAVSFANGVVFTDSENYVAERVFVNASGSDGVIINVRSGVYNVKAENCLGDVLFEKEMGINGITAFDVPVAGRLTLTK